MKVAALILSLVVVASGQATTRARPSSAEEIQELRSVIHAMQKQIADLREENKRLRKASADQAVAKPVAGGKTSFTREAKKRISRDSTISRDETKELLDRAAKIDDKIQSYIASHPEISPEISEAMWKGDVVVGMKREQFEIYGWVTPDSESRLGKRVSFQSWSPWFGLPAKMDISLDKDDVVDHVARYGGEPVSAPHFQ